MRKWQNWRIFFFVSGIQFFTMETTVNRRNCQYRMTQSPRNHVSDTGHPLMGTISGRPLWLGPNQTISGLKYSQPDWTICSKSWWTMMEGTMLPKVFWYIYLGISICGGMLVRFPQYFVYFLFGSLGNTISKPKNILQALCGEAAFRYGVRITLLKIPRRRLNS